MEKYSISHLKKQKFSLVLAGGAALGFAHLGIIKFLEENNLKPSEIVGTSFGSLIGALYAQGYTYDELYEITTKVDMMKLFSLKYGQGGLKNHKIYDYLAEFYKGKKISETKIPLKLVATNFLTGEGRAFSKKDNMKIVDGVMSSISIPAIFSPVKIKNNYYVDGYLASNLPVDYTNTNSDMILAIDVTNKTVISDFRIRKNGFFKRTKEILEASENSFNWMVIKQTEQKIKDLETNKQKYILIEPNLKGFGKQDFKKGVGLSKRGYSAIKNYFN